MPARLLVFAALLSALAAQQAPVKPPPDDEVTAYLNERRAPAIKQLTLQRLCEDAATEAVAGNYNEAAAIYQEVLKQDFNFYNAIAGLAHVYVKQNRSRDAMQLLEEHASKNAALATIVTNIASEFKQYDWGLGVLATMPQYLPYDDLYSFKARLYSDKGDFDSAIAVLRAARGPKRDDVEIALAEMLTFAGHGDEANKVYQQVLHVNPKDGRALLRRYNELMDSAPGNMLVAFSCAKLAAALLPDDPDALDALATTYQYAQAEYNRSIEILEQAVAKAPQVSKYHYHLAQALMMSVGESTRAREELHKALETNPSAEDRTRIEQTINQLEMMHPSGAKAPVKR